ncbi:hypothetical protein E4T45_06621 [Aureobasidium sp. EXF-8846]|nr:hypothetical protein E4T45_06621 [Aureobasidium sp. EXF-8846]
MAIENIMMETDQVTINHFFTQVHQQEGKESATPILTFIHHLSAKLWGPTKELRVTDHGDMIFQSPFNNCDASTIQQKLEDMEKTTGTAINTHWFLVLDQRSERDDTAVIVNVDEEGVRDVRVAFTVASQYLAATSIAHPGIDELIEIVESEGSGVLRD